jgi:C-terminal processing protease CtpA/Prc
VSRAFSASDLTREGGTSRIGRFVIVSLCSLLTVVVLTGQTPISKDDRAMYKQMLGNLRKDLAENYYDKGFRGKDLSQLFQNAAEKVAAATTTAEAVDSICGTLFEFGDSHTRFFTPPRAIRVNYGWTLAAVGDAPLVMWVDPASDAAKQGLAPGDRVLAVNRFLPSRENLWQILHYYRVIRPQAQQHLVVRKPDGTERAFDIASKVKRIPVMQLSDAIDDAISEGLADPDLDGAVEPGIVIWRMRMFGEAEDMGPFVAKARNAKALVLDLRGNGGGLLDGLKALVGWTFDREIHVMTRVGRKGERREIARPRSKPFLGKLVVLVDSRSAGKVMVSEMFGHAFGAIGHETIYGASITVSDSVMPDGARLEGVGVTPDEFLVPTPADLAAGRDPVLARAVATLGGALTPEAAGRLQPVK